MYTYGYTLWQKEWKKEFLENFFPNKLKSTMVRLPTDLSLYYGDTTINIDNKV